MYIYKYDYLFKDTHSVNRIIVSYQLFLQDYFYLCAES